jgi:hypothetical protein
MDLKYVPRGESGGFPGVCGRARRESDDRTSDEERALGQWHDDGAQVDAANKKATAAALHDQDDLMRKYGAVLARRVAEIDKGPLLYAASIDYLDVKDFADTSISLL